MSLRQLKRVSLHRMYSGVPVSLFSSNSFDPNEPCTVVDGQGIVVSWHPSKQKHPYEYTRVIPNTETSPFKLKSGKLREEMQKDFLLSRKSRNSSPLDHELQDMFYTDKHIWQKKPTYSRINRTLQPEPKQRNGL